MKNLLLSLLLLPDGNTLPAVIPSADQAASKPAAALAYDFTRPAATYPMPSELRELSGIALAGPGRITGIEDETGNLYEYSLTAKKVERVVAFAKSGDYEDLARVGNGWFVLRSDGTLFHYTGTTTKEYETGLGFANNTEGLAYDAATKTLLVACKGSPGNDLPDGKRAIYRLQPGTYRAEAKPAYVLDEEAIAGAAPAAESPAKKSNKKGKKGGALKGFAPSAVAVHPITRHIFVLSARQNAIVELNRAGQLLGAQVLPANLFPQAEGMAFAPNGDLYLATEAGGKADRAAIYLFHPKAGK